MTQKKSDKQEGMRKNKNKRNTERKMQIKTEPGQVQGPNKNKQMKEGQIQLKAEDEVNKICGR